MKPWKLYCMGLAPLALLASTAMGQGLPAITPPPGLAIAPQPPPVNAPVPPTALPPNIWDQITPRADQCAACKAKICNSRIGQLFNNMLTPIGAMSGGLLGPCCPTINAADLAKPPDSAEGAVARLKLDEADAAARRGHPLHGRRRLPLLAGGDGGPDRRAAGRPQRVRAAGSGAGAGPRLLLQPRHHEGADADGVGKHRGRQPARGLRARQGGGAGRAEPLPGQLHRGRTGPRGAGPPRRRADPSENRRTLAAAQAARNDPAADAQTAHDAEPAVRPDRVLPPRGEFGGKKGGDGGPPARWNT